MILKRYLLFVFSLFSFSALLAQVKDKPHFNHSYWDSVADNDHLSNSEKIEMISVQQAIFESKLKHQHTSIDEILWVTHPSTSSQKVYGQNSVNAGPCTNMDFETGTMSGWTRSTGYNPLTNSVGCCSSPNGDQTVMTGLGTDTYGGFPVVYPGGIYSLRLGSTAVGGIADRISQTFFVTAANANFTYRYAAVLNDPGHIQAQQPRFTSEIIDSLGNPILCNTNSVVVGGGIPGFSISPTTGPGASAVRYKPWTDVVVDLTANIGQNVTIRFTVYDCSPTGHFGYVYLDGSCGSFNNSATMLSCQNTTDNLCVQPGFLSSTWDGPGISSITNSCISVTAAGIYSCSTTLMSGCPGPSFNYTVSLIAKPTASFSTLTTGGCSKQYTFNGTASVSSGSITSYLWSFGDGTSASLASTAHTYTQSGLIPVKLKVTSDNGCVDSIINNITIFPEPDLSFNPPSGCLNATVQFTNTSTISAGTIATYTWALGNGSISNLLNPLTTYTSAGVYSITLSGTSNLGCIASKGQPLTIAANPIITFTSINSCSSFGVTFTPTISISSGTITNVIWDFGDSGSSVSLNPFHLYATTGIYSVSLTAFSAYNCSTTVSNTVNITPPFTSSFSSMSVDACSQSYTFTNNSFPPLSTSMSYTWNIGAGFSSTSTSLSYTFPTTGNYTVSLTGLSNFGCGDTAVQSISIHPYPIVTFSAPVICQNSTFTVSTSVISGSVTNYSWNFGDPGSGSSNTSTVQNPSHIYALSNTYTISLNALNQYNCLTQTSLPIIVNPNPTIGVNSGSICSGQSFTLIPTGASTYTYLNGSTVVTPLLNSTFSVTGTSAQGCIGTNTAISSVVVNTLPVISSSNGTLCSGSSFTLNPSGANSYIYSSGTAIVSPTANTSYSITGTSIQGCAGSNIAISTITVIPKPLIVINSGTICSGNSFTLIPSGAVSYIYSGGSATITPASSTSYTVTGISAQGCTNSAVANVTVYISPTISVNHGTICSGNSFTLLPSGAYTYSFSSGSAVVNPNATSSYSVTGMSIEGCPSTNIAYSSIQVHILPSTYAISSNSSICLGETATLSANGASTYFWNAASNSSSLVITPSVSTIYTVTGISENGCSRSFTLAQIVSPCTKISDLEPEFNRVVTIYPNPNAGEFLITTDSEQLTLYITNAIGQGIKTIVIHESGSHRVFMDDVAEGIYFVTEKNKINSFKQKIIIQK